MNSRDKNLRSEVRSRENDATNNSILWSYRRAAKMKKSLDTQMFVIHTA